ncbi:MAG: ABC-F type ribosomal protection protein [Acutalibacteraceae bacterium]|nr:ABC-F type ribosomal protection protein [Acutalibacteraceae bacterium]
MTKNEFVSNYCFSLFSNKLKYCYLILNVLILNNFKIKDDAFMQIKIQNGVVDLSGEPILKNVNIEINTESKIGIVGRNGCGKTTLLRLLSGELEISQDDPSVNSFHIVSGKPIIGTLSQLAFKDNSIKMVDEIRSAYSDIISMKSELSSLQKEMEINPTAENIQKYTTLLDAFTNDGGFYFEKEYEAAIIKFGFTSEDKEKPLSDFSGGQRTKIAFLKLLLSKPDLLLLDEPTNHLDVEAVAWLEDYLSDYKKAVVIVSHDRMFLDKTVKTIYEIERGKTYKYDGNYSSFVEQKKQVREQQAKDYEAQQKEISKLNELIERFRYKATKAAMVQSKIKQLKKMDIIEPPESYDSKQFHANFQPDLRSAKDVLNVSNLKIGYESVICELSFNILRGQHIGIIGGNGKGKSTLLKTIVGAIPYLDGSFTVGNNVRVGYFDQQMAQYTSDKTVFDDFLDEFPFLDNFQVRNALGAFLFSGDDVFKRVDMLSGGEKVRLALCKLFKKKPNFLILDEPTNHMDIVGKETLESMLSDFDGTILFVSHDRYFVKKVADSLLVFEENGTSWYEF